LAYRLAIGTKGQPQTLHYKQFVLPPLDAEEVLVEVKASALNFKDLMLALGMLNLPGGQGTDVNLGLEFSGIILDVGSNVAPTLKKGMEVFGVGKFCFANRVVTLQSFVVPKPSFLTHTEAASIPITYATSYAGLVSKGQMQKVKKKKKFISYFDQFHFVFFFF